MATYRDSVAKIRSMKKELESNYMIMSQYERQRIEAAIENEVNRRPTSVVAGAAGRMAAALSSHKAAGRAIDEARRKEAQRWQPDRMNMEMQFSAGEFDRCQSGARSAGRISAGARIKRSPRDAGL